MDAALQQEREKFIGEAMGGVYTEYQFLQHYLASHERYKRESAQYERDVAEYNAQVRKYNQRLKIREREQAQIDNFNRVAARVAAAVNQAFHDFRQWAALLPTPVINEDHALQLFAEMFHTLPVARDQHLAKYAAIAPQRFRDVLDLPEPEAMPALSPLEQRPRKEPLAPTQPMSYSGNELQSYESIQTWGDARKWEKVNGRYEPTGHYRNNIPTGPTDLNIRRLPVYRNYNQYERDSQTMGKIY